MPQPGRHLISDKFRKDSMSATDACLTGCGDMNLRTKEFFHSQFPQSILEQEWHIKELELLGIMSALKLIEGEEVQNVCDNTVLLVATMNKARTRNVKLQRCMREISYLLAKHECELFTLHIRE